MKANTLITLYNARTKDMRNITPDIMQRVIVDLIKPIGYIPYDRKLQLIEQVIKDNVNVKYPTAGRYRSFIIYLVNAYTNLELDKNGFDVLVENKIMDIVLSSFKSEYEICNALLQMCLDDTLMKEG